MVEEGPSPGRRRPQGLLAYLELLVVAPAALLTTLLPFVCLAIVLYLGVTWENFTAMYRFVQTPQALDYEPHKGYGAIVYILILAGPISLLSTAWLWGRSVWIWHGCKDPARRGILYWSAGVATLPLALLWDLIFLVVFVEITSRRSIFLR